MPRKMESSLALWAGRRVRYVPIGPWGEALTGNRFRTRFTYTGHQREARTGNYYSVYRYLDPRAGRWTQRDPLRGVDGPNEYLYVSNRPLANRDPHGLRMVPGNFDAVQSAALLRTLAPSRETYEELCEDPCKAYVIVVQRTLSPYGSDIYAATTAGPSIRRDYKRCRCSDGPPVHGTIAIYARARVPGSLGYELDPASAEFPLKWVTIRLAHELWHAYSLISSQETDRSSDAGYALGDAMYLWLKGPTR
jgi:RHS repeat-associated protein